MPAGSHIGTGRLTLSHIILCAYIQRPALFEDRLLADCTAGYATLSVYPALAFYLDQYPSGSILLPVSFYLLFSLCRPPFAFLYLNCIPVSESEYHPHIFIYRHKIHSSIPKLLVKFCYQLGAFRQPLEEHGDFCVLGIAF